MITEEEHYQRTAVLFLNKMYVFNHPELAEIKDMILPLNLEYYLPENVQGLFEKNQNRLWSVASNELNFNFDESVRKYTHKNEDFTNASSRWLMEFVKKYPEHEGIIDWKRLLADWKVVDYHQSVR